VELYLHSPNTP